MRQNHLSDYLYLSASVLSALLMVSCTRSPVDANYLGPSAITEITEQSYAYEKYQGIYTEQILDKNQYYTLQRITFPSNNNILQSAHDISIDYYAIDSSEKVPVILVLPILSGQNKIATSFARYFAEYGFATAVVHRQQVYEQTDYLQQTNKIMRQIVFDHKQVLDWVESRAELDALRIGVVGTSMGGIKSALISALDKRIKATVIILGGGDIPYLLALWSQKRVKKEAGKVLVAAQQSAMQSPLVAKKIECDPINYAHYIDARRTLMILARFDSVIPFYNGLQLKEKIGNPETIYLFAGHYSAIIYLPYARYMARKFLQKQLQ